MKIVAKIKYILLLLVAIGIFIWRLAAGKKPEFPKFKSIEVKHNQETDKTVDNIEAKYRDK